MVSICRSSESASRPHGVTKGTVPGAAAHDSEPHAKVDHAGEKKARVKPQL